MTTQNNKTTNDVVHSLANPAQVPVFILAGGRGTRLSEETSLRPKPMVEIDGVPIIVHLMRSYQAHGFNDFVICAGYKSWIIKEFFLHYRFRMNHLEIDHREDRIRPTEIFSSNDTQESWRVRVIDTGENAMTGARIARAFDLVQERDPFNTFAVTYGDGLSDVNLREELLFHHQHGKVGTVLGVKATPRFGELDIASDATVTGFLEKPESKQGLINGGFFFFNKEFRKSLSTEEMTILERAPLEKLAEEGQLKVFSHTGFWTAIDTLRDKEMVEEKCRGGKLPWLR